MQFDVSQQRALSQPESKLPQLRALAPQTQEFVDNPYPYYETLREQGSVVEVTDLPRSHRTIALLGYHVAEMALKDPRLDSNMARSTEAKFAARGNVPIDQFPGSAVSVMERFVVYLDGELHHRIRDFISLKLSRDAVTEMTPQIRQLVEERFDAATEQGSSFCLVDKIARPLPLTVIGHQIGLHTLPEIFNPEAVADIARSTISVSATHEHFFRASALLKANTPKLRNLLEDSSEGRAVLEKWNEVTNEPLPMLLSNIVFFMIAGHETTTNLICNMTEALIRFPEVWDSLKRGQISAAAVVKESLRFDPPVQNTLRRAHEDMTIEGVPVRKGDQVAVMLAAANRDPAKFSEPDHFILNRKGGFGLSFGAGKHGCPGFSLAQVEAQLYLETLLERADRLELIPGSEPIRRPNPTLRGFTTFPIILKQF